MMEEGNPTRASDVSELYSMQRTAKSKDGNWLDIYLPGVRGLHCV